MGKGIQYLRELAMVEMIYGVNLDENTKSQGSDDMVCTQPIRWRIVQNAPSSKICTLTGMNWKDIKRPTVDEADSHFDNMKIVSLPPYGPVFELWRNCSRSFSSLKTICLALHLYKPIPLLLEVSIPPLLKRKDTVGTHHILSSGFTFMIVEEI